jgi:hypothetical protein
LLEVNTNNAVDNLDLGRGNDHELPVFNFHLIEAATENFATRNKLGEGGFGPVYKVDIFLSYFVFYLEKCKYEASSLF